MTQDTKEWMRILKAMIEMVAIGIVWWQTNVYVALFVLLTTLAAYINEMVKEDKQ